MDNYSEQHKNCINNSRHINLSITRFIDLSGSKHSLWFSINISTKGKVEIMADGCADTSVAFIGNGFVEVSQTNRKVIFVDCYDNLFKECILVWDYAAAIGTILFQLDEAPLLHGGSNFLLFIAKNFGFVVAVHDFDYNHVGKQYIHYEYCVIPIKFENAFMFVTILEPTQCDLDNLTLIMLTLDHPWG